jgi:bifunctional non-homologous end joining protein LigD
VTAYRPMLASAWPAPFDDPGWVFEVKWDGYRCLMSTDDGLHRLTSRRGIELGERFPEVAALDLAPGWILDGEVVVFDETGRSDFSLLQGGRPASYVVFDVLESPAGTVTGAPLEERLALLESLELPGTVVRSQVIPGEGRALFAAADARGLEGIVGKRLGSRYLAGRRTPDWRKVAARRRMRAAVGGWLPGVGGRGSTFGSLLVGLWEGGRLHWVGAVGSGFTDGQLGPIAEALRALERPDPPFASVSGIPAGARWAEPGIVVEIEYKEWTRDGRLRAPVFKGVEPAGSFPSWEEEGPERP